MDGYRNASPSLEKEPAVSARGSKRSFTVATPPGIKWSEILEDYDQHHRPNRNNEIKWFAGQTSFEQVIFLAARAEGENHKRLDHQRRILKTAIPAAEQSLKARINLLRQSPSFESLLSYVNDAVIHIRGIGELYCYDAALRIGAYLGLAPESIYLHAGTGKGARALIYIPHKTRLIDRELLPHPLRSRPAAEIENILCVYKDTFTSGVLTNPSRP